MSAIFAWNKVPALYFMHGWIPWEEQPPVHPRILAYAGTSWRFGHWAAERTGITPESVHIVPNFFDPERIPFCPTPAHNRKAALFFGHIKANSREYEILEKGAQRAGFTLSPIGVASGVVESDPASLLKDFEMVFASGRSAIEAMASGCAVAPISAETIGELITLQNFERLSGINFCAEQTDAPISEETVCARLTEIDAHDRAEVAGRIREQSTLDQTIKRLTAIYDEVVESFDESLCPDVDRELHAASQFISTLALSSKQLDAGHTTLAHRLDNSQARAERWKLRALRAEGKLRLLKQERGSQNGLLKKLSRLMGDQFGKKTEASSTQSPLD
jgi:hypothetical protein